MLNSETNRSPRSLIATPCGDTTRPGLPQLRLELIGADSLAGIGTELRHDLAGFVQHTDLASELPNDGVVSGDDHRRRQPQVFGDDAQEFPVQGQVHDAIVGAVAGDQAHRLVARVNRELVQRAEVVGLLLAAERFQVLAGAIEAMDVVAGVAVGDVEVAVGRHIHAGQRQRQLVAPRIPDLELIRNRGGRDRHHHLAVERHLDDRLFAQARLRK